MQLKNSPIRLLLFGGKKQQCSPFIGYVNDGGMALEPFTVAFTRPKQPTSNAVNVSDVTVRKEPGSLSGQRPFVEM